MTPTTITIGYITSETGGGASSFVGGEKGTEAAFDALNAKGGVDGRQLKLDVVDDQSTSTGNLTAAQDLVNKGVFGIIDMSSQDYGAAAYLNKQGIPIAGDCCNDAQYGTDSNMFSQYGGENPNDTGAVDYTIYPQLFKSLGVTKVAGFAYGIAPSSQKDIKQLKSTLAASGIQMPYENLSLPLGTNDFTTYALAMKRDGVQGGDCPCVQSTNLAMISAAKQAGITPFTSVLATSADSTVFTTPALTALLQGTIWPTYTVPLDLNIPAANAFVANLTKYDSAYKGGYATFGTTDSYLAGDIMTYGLKLAGPNPTRKSFIADMLKVSSYDDGGLLPYPIGWDHLGKLAPNSCAYFLKVVGTKYVDLNGGKPFCGPLLSIYKS